MDWGISGKQEVNQIRQNLSEILIHRNCSHGKKCYNLEHLKNKPLDVSLVKAPSQSSLSNSTKTNSDLGVISELLFSCSESD